MSVWKQHVQQVRSENPGVPFKDILQMAAKTYTKSGGGPSGSKPKGPKPLPSSVMHAADSINPAIVTPLKEDAKGWIAKNFKGLALQSLQAEIDTFNTVQEIQQRLRELHDNFD